MGKMLIYGPETNLGWTPLFQSYFFICPFKIDQSNVICLSQQLIPHILCGHIRFLMINYNTLLNRTSQLFYYSPDICLRISDDLLQRELENSRSILQEHSLILYQHSIYFRFTMTCNFDTLFIFRTIKCNVGYK